MPPNKLNVSVENFGLDAQAQQRVQNALHTTLERELRAVGAADESGVFGDGSVKGGMVASQAAGQQAQ